MTPELLSSIAGILLSLAASYLPGFSTWYDGLAPNFKRLIMLAGLFAVVFGVFGLACAGLSSQLGFTVTCDVPGAYALLKAFLAAVIANQTAFLVAPRKGR